MPASIILSALVAVLVGFGGTLALVIAAAQALGADAAETASCVTAICLATAAATAALSIRHRIPIMAAWSTPGAALIAATTGMISLESAAGAFILAGGLIVLTAMVRPLGALIDSIPTSLAAAMLAGVLIRFVMPIFEQAQIEPGLVLPLVAVFLVVRLFSPAGAVLAALVAGLALTFSLGLAEPVAVTPRLSGLVFVAPEFEAQVLIGVGLPLYLVTMAGQNLPGFAVLRASGYPVPAQSILATTGVLSVVTALFGALTTNLAAITASICTGSDAHPDPAKRWLCGPVYAAGYLVLAGVGGYVVSLITAMPTALIATVAGLALLSPLVNALGAALAEPRQRLAATMTLAVTASGMALLGIGSAFWGLCAGLVVLGLDAAITKRRSISTPTTNAASPAGLAPQTDGGGEDSSGGRLR